MIYNIPDDSKIVLYVGNIGVRKNQRQLIQSFDLMPRDVCEKTYVLFLGNDQGTDSVSEAISNSRYASHFRLCGSIDKEIVSDYYKQGNAVVLISRSEGFGLSLIEGMHFGLPCMTFTDVDAYEDIYSEYAVVGVEDKSNISVAQGLEKLLTIQWDKERIKRHSKKFELDKMGENYINWLSNEYKRKI